MNDVLTTIGALVIGIVVLVWLWQLDVKVERLRRDLDSLNRSQHGHTGHRTEWLDRRERP